MNKSYDVYMCRGGNCKEAERLPTAARDNLWSYWGKKVDKEGFLQRDANSKLVRSKGA